MKDFIWHSNEENSLKQKTKWDLSVMYSALKSLGDPHKNIEKRVIHIAGTNGKGSTASYIKTILESSGYKVGLFTSPHLVKYNERIYANNRFITDNEIKKYKQQIVTKCKNANKISFFEATTLIAILFFSELQKTKKLDYFIFEVGLGGRLDATNVFKKPLVSVITSISLDHVEKLGDTITKIAHEKGGIIKPKVPVFTSNTNKEIIKELQRIADKKNTKLFRLNKDFNLYKNIAPSLAGEHQIYNSTLAGEVCKFIGIKQKNIKQGLTTTTWNGRLQQIELKKINKKTIGISKIYIDGAHNEDGIRVLCNFINQTYNEYLKNDKKPNIICIFACLERKDYKSFFPILKTVKLNNLLFFDVPKNVNNFADVKNLLNLAEKHKIKNKNIIKSFTEIKKYTDKSKNNIIFIFGSLYFIGWILENHTKK